MRRARSRVQGRLLFGILACVGSAATLFALPGCTLEEITLAAPEPRVQAEVYLRVTDGVPSGVGLLYTTSSGDSDPGIGDARIVITAPDGRTANFQRRNLAECVEGSLPPEFDAACYRLTGVPAFLIQPGRSYRVQITWPGGGSLQGETTLPGNFRILSPRSGAVRCHLPPERVLPLRWEVASGARAYVPEAEIFGLTAAFQNQDISVPSEPLVIIGLSVSESDTAILFPSQFGIFNRLSSDRDLLVALQRGLPAEGLIEGRIVISAQDRNTVNWNRGGNFNPSGQVRTPSLVGDGGGVIGGVVNRSFSFTTAETPSIPSCLA
jgi:hypothetical protein